MKNMISALSFLLLSVTAQATGERISSQVAVDVNLLKINAPDGIKVSFVVNGANSVVSNISGDAANCLNEQVAELNAALKNENVKAALKTKEIQQINVSFDSVYGSGANAIWPQTNFPGAVDHVFEMRAGYMANSILGNPSQCNMHGSATIISHVGVNSMGSPANAKDDFCHFKGAAFDYHGTDFTRCSIIFTRGCRKGGDPQKQYEAIECSAGDGVDQFSANACVQLGDLYAGYGNDIIQANGKKARAKKYSLNEINSNQSGLCKSFKDLVSKVYSNKGLNQEGQPTENGAASAE
jgi:hypothetical protein